MMNIYVTKNKAVNKPTATKLGDKPFSIIVTPMIEAIPKERHNALASLYKKSPFCVRSDNTI